MLVIYSIVLYLLIPFVLLRVLIRSLKAPAYRRRLGERFGFSNIEPQPGGIWVHAVSVGESIAAVKLIKAIQQAYPQYAITVTCGTPTGSEIIRQQLGEGVFHVYAPYDLPGSVRRFLRRCQPAVGIIMETEIWPNMLHAAARDGVWLLLSNMRLSETSARRYSRFGGLIGPGLRHFKQIAAQTDADADRAIRLGARPESMTVTGNLKFEISAQAVLDGERLSALYQQFSAGRTVWLAGSTHPGEDEQVLAAHAELLKTDASLLMILVPRHPERFDAVYRLCQNDFSVQRRSTLVPAQQLDAGVQLLLLDSMGELANFIQISDWAFIGGSLVPVGGHNVLEACQSGVPVIFGPYMHNFLQVAKMVVQQQAGIQVETHEGLLNASFKLMNDRAARQQMGQRGQALIEQNSGALARTMVLLDGVLGNE